MCGIAGIVHREPGGVDHDLLARMCDRLQHRGPDDRSYYVGERAGLGQCRLSIIDLPGGRQPMPNEDETVWVTFNGEIYNFQELRRCLIDAGHRFATASDTEVIVHAYEEYGSECVTRFRGMFAFALWDDREQSLLLARDRVGKKPLFYADLGDEFLFGSELQAILSHPRVSRDVDPAAIDDYLSYGYIPAPNTAFTGVFKLPPAHTLIVLAGRSSRVEPTAARRYWQLRYAPKTVMREEEAAEGLLEVLREAVRLRLIADVPLGALLSGGLDSSLVVALMSELSDRPVKTFSIGFDEHAFNELPYARAVAERFGTEHHELVVRPNALEILPTLVRHYGEPYADSSCIPTYYVAMQTRQHVKVALNGDGGDECFAGYERYLASAMADRYRTVVPAPVRSKLIEPLLSLIPESLPTRNRILQAKHFLPVASLPFESRYLQWMTYFSPEMKRDLYSSDFRAETGDPGVAHWLAGLMADYERQGTDHVDTMLGTDVNSYLPYDLLVKMDIATMANSLEARSPFLDHEVMEFCACLPSSFKVRRMALKYLLKQVGTSVLPAENVKRRKMGFGVPVGPWMRGEMRPLLQDALLSPSAHIRGYFQSATLSQLVDDHVTGTRDRTFQLWALMWLEMWHRDIATGYVYQRPITQPVS